MPTLTPTTVGTRTVLRDEDGVHVGTIIEHIAAKKQRGKMRPGHYQWIAAGGGGFVDYYLDAEDEILADLER